MGEKNGKKLNNQMIKSKEKITVGLPSHPRFYNMEADSFPVYKRTENKPDLP